MSFLGLDLGASYCKAVLLGSNGETTVVKEPMPDFEDRPSGRSELSSREVNALLLQVIRRICVPGHEPVEALAVTGQMHGLLLVDRFGRPQTPFVTWQDTRTLDRMPDSEKSYLAFCTSSFQDRQARTGSFLRAGMMGPLLCWFRENRPELLASTRATFLPPYMVSVLTDAAPRTDSTHAAATGVFDIHARSWLPELTTKLGLPASCLPELTTMGRIAGRVSSKTSRSTGLAEGTPAYASFGDYQAALWGSASLPGDLVINVGTGAQVSLIRKQPDVLKDVETRPLLDDSFALCIPGLPGGRSIALFKDFLKSILGCYALEFEPDLEVLEQAAGDQTDAPPVDSDFFSTAGGSLRNLRKGNFSAPSVYRGLLEDLANRYAGAARQILSACRLSEPRRLILAGGVLRRSGLLRDLLSRHFPHTEMLHPSRPEEAAFGAALAARRWFSGNKECP